MVITNIKENNVCKSSSVTHSTMNNDSESGDDKGSSRKMSPEMGGSHHLNPHQNHYFSSHLLRAVLLFTMVTLTCLVHYQPSTFYKINLPQSLYSISHANNNIIANTPGNKELELKQVLKRAAMKDKTVIITTLNEAWIEPDSIFDLFLESFRIGHQTFGLLKHLVVVALDQNAFDHCLGLHLNCYFLKTEGVDFSGEAHFMTPDYLKMMWRRIDFLRAVLEMGFNFVFTDADIMWFRNPFPHFYSNTEFQISCDHYRGNPYDLRNAPNGGFNYVKSSNQTIEFYKFWYQSRKSYPRKHDQDVLNKIKYDPLVKGIIGLKIKFLDTAYFGGFCSPSKNLNLVCTMHANCCAGLDNKIHDLKILLQDWRKYLSLPKNARKIQPLPWSVPQSCGPASFRRHTARKKKNGGGTRK